MRANLRRLAALGEFGEAALGDRIEQGGSARPILRGRGCFSLAHYDRGMERRTSRSERCSHPTPQGRLGVAVALFEMRVAMKWCYASLQQGMGVDDGHFLSWTRVTRVEPGQSSPERFNQRTNTRDR